MVVPAEQHVDVLKDLLAAGFGAFTCKGLYPAVCSALGLGDVDALAQLLAAPGPMVWDTDLLAPLLNPWHGSLEALQLVLAAGKELWRQEQLLPAVETAVHWQDKATLRVLLGVKVGGGWTAASLCEALEQAVQHSDLEMVKAILLMPACDWDVDALQGPLQSAVQQDDALMVATLLGVPAVPWSVEVLEGLVSAAACAGCHQAAAGVLARIAQDKCSCSRDRAAAAAGVKMHDFSK